MPVWLQAAGWGLLASSSLLLGAALGYGLRLSPRLIAGTMAFGAGVLFSALSFELVEEAYRQGGAVALAGGLLGGAVAYTAVNEWLARQGARHRKRSGGHQPSEAEDEGSGLALAVGALLDGIPESVVLGVSLLQGQSVSLVVLAALFLSNLPEGLSSAAGMKRAGRSARYVFSVWGGIVLLSALAALVGCVALAGAPASTIAVVSAVAAGAVLTMLVDTMVPEAFAEAHGATGLITVAGFLTAFLIDRLAG